MTDQKPKPIHVGLFDDIPNAEYHGGPGISKSGLDLIERSPLHYITQKRHPKPTTPTFVIGSAVHSIVLEPDKFEDEYVKEPVDAPLKPTDKMVKDYAEGKASKPIAARVDFWEQWEQENSGKIVLGGKTGDDPFWQPSTWDQVHRMRDAVLAHPLANILLDHDDGIAEQSCLWVDRATGKLCKCRPDFRNYPHNVLVDLKTTEDASYFGFNQSAGKFRYFVQDPWYLDGMTHNDVLSSTMIFVTVEKQPPYGVGLYEITREAREIGRMHYRSLLEVYAKCHESQEWPCYPSEVRQLDISKFQLARKVS